MNFLRMHSSLDAQTSLSTMIFQTMFMKLYGGSNACLILVRGTFTRFYGHAKASSALNERTYLFFPDTSPRLNMRKVERDRTVIEPIGNCFD